MLANLDRKKFIELLNNLGDDDKEKVLAAAQNLHAQVVVAGISWEDLLVPETEENKSDATNEADEEQTPVSTESDSDIKELSEEEIQEALLLIKKISELNVSSETIKDLSLIHI